MMNLPNWTKPGVYGAIVGAVVVSVAGFSAGGWVTGSTADKTAKAMAYTAVTDAMVPVCLEIAAADSGRAEQLANIQRAASYERHTVVMEAGWATPPGFDAPNRDLARACLSGLDLDAS